MGSRKSEISEATKRVVDFFKGYHKSHGKRPTFREAMRALGLSSASVIHFHVKRAERLGIEIPGESAFAIDIDIRALSACINALNQCTKEGLKANLTYLVNRYSSEGVCVENGGKG